MNAAEVVQDVAKGVEVAHTTSHWLRAEQGYALAVIMLIGWTITGIYMVWRTKQYDATLALANAALDAAHKRMTEVLVTLLTHAREKLDDDTPPPKT